MGYFGKLPSEELRKPVDFNYATDSDCAEELKTRMKLIYQEVSKNLEEARQRRTKQFDKKATKIPHYYKNQHVWLHDPVKLTGPGRKFALPYTGPFKIMGIRNVCIKLKNLQNKKVITAHLDRIKPCYDVHGNFVFSPPEGAPMKGILKATKETRAKNKVRFAPEQRNSEEENNERNIKNQVNENRAAKDGVAQVAYPPDISSPSPPLISCNNNLPEISEEQYRNQQEEEWLEDHSIAEYLAPKDHEERRYPKRHTSENYYGADMKDYAAALKWNAMKQHYEKNKKSPTQETQISEPRIQACRPSAVQLLAQPPTQPCLDVMNPDTPASGTTATGPASAETCSPPEYAVVPPRSLRNATRTTSTQHKPTATPSKLTPSNCNKGATNETLRMSASDQQNDQTVNLLDNAGSIAVQGISTEQDNILRTPQDEEHPIQVQLLPSIASSPIKDHDSSKRRTTSPSRSEDAFQNEWIRLEAIERERTGIQIYKTGNINSRVLKDPATLEIDPKNPSHAPFFTNEPQIEEGKKYFVRDSVRIRNFFDKIKVPIPNKPDGHNLAPQNKELLQPKYNLRSNSKS